MNLNNRPPSGNSPQNNHAFHRRVADVPTGRGFAFHPNNRGRGVFHGGRGVSGGRGPPPPPPRGRGHGPHRGARGFFHTRGGIFTGGRGPPSMFDPGRGNIPPPPPVPRIMEHGIPPPPPPRQQQPGRGIPPPPIPGMSISQQAQPVYGQTHMNQFHQSNPTQNNHLPQVLQQQRNTPQLHPQVPPMSLPVMQASQYSAPVQQSAESQAPHSQVVSAEASAQAPSSYTQDQIDKAWTEHTAPNAMKYYYNGITKESTYTRPSALTRATLDSSGSKWVAYTDAASGKTYYSDGTKTTWEKPEGFQEPAALTENKDDKPPKKKRKVTQQKPSRFSSKAEAIAAFKGLLLAKDIQPTTKWNEASKACSSDSRWEACEILTQGERKQALAEYQTKRANELRDLERQERMRAKDAFTELLTEVLPNLDTFNPMSSRLTEMRDSLSKDDRFYAVEDEKTRESLFLEFCEEVRKRDERKRRSRKREAKDSFFALLKERQEKGKLSFASTWSSFFASLDDKYKTDSRFQVSSAMSDSDRELYFSDFVIELQAEEDEKRRRIRDARRRAEKAQREAYRDLLIKLAVDSKIVPSTRWRNIEDVIANESAFKAMQDQGREAPRELFQDFIDEWNDVYRRDRSFLSRLLQSSSNKKGTKVTAESKFDDFTKELLDHAAFSPDQYSTTRQILNHDDPVSSARIYFNELVTEAKEDMSKFSRRHSRRGSVKDDSSEDEGEIIEDGEIEDIVQIKEQTDIITQENTSSPNVQQMANSDVNDQ